MPRKKDSQEPARIRAFHVLARMRRTGHSLTVAAREEHVDPRTVKKFLGSELRRLIKEGELRPTKSDQRRRRMFIPTEQGNVAETIRGSAEASRLGSYMAAVGKLLRTGDAEGLAEFRGQSIAGHSLITDPETLMSLAEAGVLHIDSIYALPE